MTSFSTPLTASSHIHQLSVARLAVTGGVTGAVLFVLCWLGTFIPYSSPTHAYIALFSGLQANSVGALLQGTVWSLLFGGVSGAIFALVYNRIDSIDRR